MEVVRFTASRVSNCQVNVNAPVLAIYDHINELRLENDASEYGLGSTLFQEGKPVAYASIYTYGRHVNVDTHHKPLVAIATKPLSKAPKRLQALLLRTQEYNYMLTYKSGTSIPVADAQYRSLLPDTSCSEQVYVNNLSFLPIKSDRLCEIRVATEQICLV